VHARLHGTAPSRGAPRRPVPTGPRCRGRSRRPHRPPPARAHPRYDALVLAPAPTRSLPPIPGTMRWLSRVPHHRGRGGHPRPRCRRPPGSAFVVGGGLLGLGGVGRRSRPGACGHMWSSSPPGADGAPGRSGRRRGVCAARSRNWTSLSTPGAATQRIDTTGCRARTMTLSDAPSWTSTWWSSPPGIRPRDQLGTRLRPTLGERGGIVVDEQCRTADPHNLGDRRMRTGRRRPRLGLVAPGYAMAETAARHLPAAGAASPAPTPRQTEAAGVDVASFGDAHAQRGRSGRRLPSSRTGVYRKL